MTTTLRLAAALLLGMMLTGCASEAPHFPRPTFRTARAALHAAHPARVRVELLAQNPTDAPLWLRRLHLTLAADGAGFADGVWEGSRLIDPGVTVLLDIALPLTEGAVLPTADTTGDLTIDTRYARSGILGLMGGEAHTYRLAIPIHHAD